MGQLESISPRERVRLALEHKETDRIPISLICSGINEPARTQFEELLKRERGVGLDQFLEPILDVCTVGPQYVGPPLPSGQDIWGVRRKPVSFGEGFYREICHYPLADAGNAGDLQDYPFPTTGLFDYTVLPDQIREIQSERERALIVYNGNLFESSWYMRGFEQIFLDMINDPEFVHALIRRVTDYHVAHIKRMLEAAKGEIDIVFTGDDIGGQHGLLMSLPMWEEFVKPYHREMDAAIHEHGAKVLYHSDGSVTKAVPGLLDMGIDILQALQFDADDMDPQVLKDCFGDRLCFEGGVSVQQTLPWGTAEEVRREVMHLIDVLGKDGGYILGPSHMIQAGTPSENILAMFDTALSYYPHGSGRAG